MGSTQAKHLTHRATNDEMDHTTMHLKNTTETAVTVFFDGDTTDTSEMAMPVYDKLTEGENWESVGFVEA